MCYTYVLELRQKIFLKFTQKNMLFILIRIASENIFKTGAQKYVMHAY